MLKNAVIKREIMSDIKILSPGPAARLASQTNPPWPKLTAAPAHCKVGSKYTNISAIPAVEYSCLTTDTWSAPGGGTGTVTSVGLTLPSWLTVAGTPVTTAGTLAATATTAQTSHQVIGTCGA